MNSVAPGFIDTPTLRVADFTPEQRAEMMKVSDEVMPPKRHGTADKVARAPRSSTPLTTFTTAVKLAVDGVLSSVGSPPS